MTGDYCDFKYLWRSVDGKRLMRFQSETDSVSKFLLRSGKAASEVKNTAYNIITVPQQSTAQCLKLDWAYFIKTHQWEPDYLAMGKVLLKKSNF